MQFRYTGADGPGGEGAAGGVLGVNEGTWVAGGLGGGGGLGRGG